MWLYSVFFCLSLYSAGRECIELNCSCEASSARGLPLLRRSLQTVLSLLKVLEKQTSLMFNVGIVQSLGAVGDTEHVNEK